MMMTDTEDTTLLTTIITSLRLRLLLRLMMMITMEDLVEAVRSVLLIGIVLTRWISVWVWESVPHWTTVSTQTMSTPSFSVLAWSTATMKVAAQFTAAQDAPLELTAPLATPAI